MSYPIIPIGSTATFSGLASGLDLTYVISVSSDPLNDGSRIRYQDEPGNPLLYFDFLTQEPNAGQLEVLSNYPTNDFGIDYYDDGSGYKLWLFNNPDYFVLDPEPNWSFVVENNGQVLYGVGPGYSPTPSQNTFGLPADVVALITSRFGSVANFLRLRNQGQI